MREALKQGKTIIAPSAYDGLTGRIAQYLGFKYVYLGGSQGAMRLALPEALMTMTEFCQIARDINTGTRGLVGIIADGGTGFGEIPQLVRTIQEFQAAGIAAVHIEDEIPLRRTALQKPAHVSPIVPLNQYLDRLKYALEARDSGDMFIIARTNAYKSAQGGTRDAAIERLLQAIELGVDAVYIDGVARGGTLGVPMDIEEAKEECAFFRKAIPEHIPLKVLASPSTLSIPELEQLGFRIICYWNGAVLAAFTGVYQFYRGVMEKGRPDYPIEIEREMLVKLRHEVCRFPEWWDIEEATTERYERDTVK
jgi:2-methylisocitrate lyase-like PEP mutase family enzyme